MTRRRAIILGILLLPYACIPIVLLGSAPDLMHADWFFFAAASLLVGAIPALAAVLLRRQVHISSTRFYATAALISLPYLLVAAVAVLGETVPAEPEGCSAVNPDVVF